MPGHPFVETSIDASQRPMRTFRWAPGGSIQRVGRWAGGYHARTMRISFVAGFGPIVRDMDASRAFWERGLGVEMTEAAPGYFTNDDLDGVKAFALWPLTQAAESTFGSTAWPDDIPAPTTWLELDVESPAAVSQAVAEMEAAGHRVLRGVHEEPWGQTTSRLLSPEGILIGITYTPWMHTAEPVAPTTGT
jgi:catechol 2,3-dioxygenase-like lactoylglutathione lyase family enzyme